MTPPNALGGATAPPPAYPPGRMIEQEQEAPDDFEAEVARAEEAARAPLPNTLDCSVSEFVLKALRSAETDGELEEERRLRVIIDNVLFYRGGHHLFADEGGIIKELPDSDDLQVHNWFAHLVDGKAKEYESSRPRIEITGTARDYRLQASANLAQALDTFVRGQSIRADFRQREAKFAMLKKNYYRWAREVYDEFDDSLRRVTEDVTERRRFRQGGVFVCQACGHEWAEADDHQQGLPADQPDDSPAGECPSCASPKVGEIIPRESYERDVKTGERERIIPRLEHVTVDPSLVKTDHRARTFQQSPTLLYDDLIRRFDAEYDEPDCDLSDVPPAADLPLRLRALLDLERSTAGVDSFGMDDGTSAHDRDDDLIRRRMFWMLPRKYAHKRARATETVGGVTIKAGQRLGDVWRSGLLAVVYGERTIARLKDESKNRSWCGSTFTLDPSTSQGKGMEDLQSLQMSVDDDATMAAGHFDRAGAPTEVVDARMLDPDEVGGYTGKRLVVKDTANENLKASDALYTSQPGQLGGDFIAFTQYKPVVMREISGVSKGMVGQEDPNNRTARGQEIAAMQSSSMMIPALALRAEEVEPETTRQTLEYIQRHWPEEMYSLFEAEYGTEAIETFRNSNIRTDYDVKAVPGSWVPLTHEQQLENFARFVAEFLIPYSQQLIPLSVVMAAAEKMNIPSHVFQPDADLKLAQSRLARVRQWADNAVQSGALELREIRPDQYYVVLAVVMSEDELTPRAGMENHIVHMEFYAEQWKKLYDDKQGNPILRDLIELLWQAHEGAASMAMMQATASAVAAEAPARMADHAQGEAQKESDFKRQKQLKAAEGGKNKKK